jgi:hypothetical protein
MTTVSGLAAGLGLAAGVAMALAAGWGLAVDSGFSAWPAVSAWRAAVVTTGPPELARRAPTREGDFVIPICSIHSAPGCGSRLSWVNLGHEDIPRHGADQTWPSPFVAIRLQAPLARNLPVPT